MSSDKKKAKRSFKDRKDGRFIKEFDPLHGLMPYMLPNRADSEAVLNEIVDLTAVDKYLEKKNETCEGFKYTIFHFVCALVAKTIQLRPEMNRFYSGKRLYEKNEISIAFTAKKKIADGSEESLVILKYDPESDVSPVEQFHKVIRERMEFVRNSGKENSTMSKVGFISKMPRPIMRIIMGTIDILDSHGKMPASMRNDDPYYTSCFVTNLGSINMHASYHHLANRGTNSLFVVVNTKKMRPFFNDDGTFEMKDSLEIGITIDERISDGVYFAKSLRVMRYYFEHPEALDDPAYTVHEIDLSLAHKK